MPFIQRANAKGIKTWMRVGSGHSTDLQAKDFSEMTADPPQRSKLVRVIRDTLEKYEMDGVYIYWKYPGCPVAFLYILCLYIVAFILVFLRTVHANHLLLRIEEVR